MSHPPATQLFCHQAFGLQIRSALALPELLLGDPTAPPDATIQFGPVPAHLPEALSTGVRYESAPGRLLLRVDNIARYLITDGQTITIERSPVAADDDIRVFLLGSAMGALLHQRKDLVLHGSAINWHGEAVVFMGHSGAGKSTTASAFRQRGHTVLTDDLCVVRRSPEGRPLAWPGFPQCKLWLDSLQKLEISPDGLSRIRQKLEKRAVPLGEQFGLSALPIRRIYLLRQQHTDDITLTPLHGPAKFNVIKNHTYRFGYLPGVSGKAGHFQQALELAQNVALTTTARPKNGFRLDALIEAITSDLSS